MNNKPTASEVAAIISTYEGMLANLTIEEFLGERGSALRARWAFWKAQQAAQLSARRVSW